MPTNYKTPDTAEPAEESKEEYEQETALLPKSILGGKEFSPGDEVVLKIVAIHEDEVEVEYAKEPSKEEDESARKTPTMDQAEADLEKLAV